MKKGPRTEKGIEAIRQSKIGAKNPNWKGNACKRRSGNDRARRLYPQGQPCSICGTFLAERHHKDGNTLNNAPRNIIFMCRKHHMEFDGRLTKLIQRNYKKKKYLITPGLQFGRWTVSGETSIYMNGIRHIFCQCYCGTERNVAVPRLINGKSTSCGCMTGRKYGNN